MSAAHIVNVGLVRVTKTGRLFMAGNPLGLVDGKPITVSDTMNYSEDYYVLPNPAVSNSLGYPTIAAYIIAEVANGYMFAHMDQTIIITQHS